MPDSGRSAAAASLATASICAFAMIATQVAGKATRDALFLSNFDIASLPLVLIASACLSIGAVLATARSLAVRGPVRVIPPLFFISGILLIGECFLAARNPRLGSIVVYLHISGLGSILISGFWSIINEHFDPRTARLSIGRIVGSATVGGLFGGILAVRVPATTSLLWVLPVIAALNVLCGVLLRRLPPAAETSSKRPAGNGAEKSSAESGFRLLTRVGYLRNLALIVLLGNVAATLIDYLFKAQAAASFSSSAELVRFFAVFYTVVSVITLVVQTGMTGRLLRELGIANTIAVRPAVVGLGGLVTLPLMGLIGLGVLRAVESVIQSSLFRSGYELLFTPVVPGAKRSTKTIVDVGADRMGDVVGGALIRLVILLPLAVADYVLMALAVLISALGFIIARALRTGYIRTLEASLLDRAGALDIAPDMHSSLMESAAGIDLSLTIDDATLRELRSVAGRSAPAESSVAVVEGPAAASGTTIAPTMRGVDPEVASLIALRSGDANRVHAELRRSRKLSPVIASQVISLLAWDDVTGWASRTLAKAAPDITGQLIDRMLDPGEDFAIRRRIPRVLATCATQRAHDGLMAALADARFEVRFQAALALARVHEQAPALVVNAADVYAVVMKETDVEKAVWDDRALIDQPAPGPALVDDAVRARAGRRTEFVFTLLSLLVPRAPLQIAFKGLLTDDAVLRGTGLEYLESVLPREIWNRLQPLLDDRRERPAEARPRDEVLERLMRSTQSIEINLEEIRKRSRET